MPRIASITSLEILDSRGRPTVQASMRLASGVSATVSVPSGASTGAAEALELRDGDPARYGGLGCRQAAGNIAGEIARALTGVEYFEQAELDTALRELDGTPNKSRLGANAILAVSLAFARASALEAGQPLFQWFANLAGVAQPSMPRLTVNLFSGGKHAGAQVPIQDILVVPVAATTVDQSLATVHAIYQAAAALQLSRYGMRLLRADEGGLAPPCASVDDMLALAVKAIQAAGFTPGKDVALAVDVASTQFYDGHTYGLGGAPIKSSLMVRTLCAWHRAFPIVSFEDGLAENDWEHWPALRTALGDDVMVMGDDLLCTNPARIRRAIDCGAANALLLKVNQIGTLTEAMEALKLARLASWKVTVSARSGETEDHWLADLAVGWAADQIKIGSITQSERLAKYNRLLAIEADFGSFSATPPAMDMG